MNQIEYDTTSVSGADRLCIVFAEKVSLTAVKVISNLDYTLHPDDCTSCGTWPHTCISSCIWRNVQRPRDARKHCEHGRGCTSWEPVVTSFKFFGKSWNHRRRSKWQSRNTRTDAVWKLSASLTRRPRLFELRPEVQSCQEVTAMAEGRRTLEPAGGSGGTCDETLVGISFHSFSLR